MTDGSGIDHREYNKSNEEADRLGKEAWSMCRLLFLEESMKELELKYGCNPNQKPADDIYGGRRTSFYCLKW